MTEYKLQNALREIHRVLIASGYAVTMREGAPGRYWVTTGDLKRSLMLTDEEIQLNGQGRCFGGVGYDQLSEAIEFLSNNESVPPTYLNLCLEVLEGVGRFIYHTIYWSATDQTLTLNIHEISRSIVIGRQSGLIALTEWTKFTNHNATKEQAIAWISGN